MRLCSLSKPFIQLQKQINKSKKTSEIKKKLMIKFLNNIVKIINQLGNVRSPLFELPYNTPIPLPSPKKKYLQQLSDYLTKKHIEEK